MLFFSVVRLVVLLTALVEVLSVSFSGGLVVESLSPSFSVVVLCRLVFLLFVVSHSVFWLSVEVVVFSVEFSAAAVEVLPSLGVLHSIFL